jgi:hypothetical protein
VYIYSLKRQDDHAGHVLLSSILGLNDSAFKSDMLMAVDLIIPNHNKLLYLLCLYLEILKKYCPKISFIEGVL